MRQLFLSAALLVVCPALVHAGLVSGQAKSLEGANIRNVTVQLFTSRGAFIDDLFFANGNYSFTITPQAADDLGVIVRFSAPNRETTTVTLFADLDNNINVALPEAKRKAPCCRSYKRARCWRRWR